MKKRPVNDDDDVLITVDNKKMKKTKPQEDNDEASEDRKDFVLLDDENLLYEVLKHADARTIATAACVSKQWHKTAEDERLWELICTKHWIDIGYGNQQLRSVVLALGGFRRLYSLYIRPLLKPPSSSSASSSSSTWPCLPPTPPLVPARSTANNKTRWGKDEVNLTLSLLSIRYYEMMNFANRGK
ncbi:unnamed protein product [Ilex paraguariensis]|uniref:F-box protein GID2 n=1 Tax=Ilex paraguariensis TaxID=185542 RepID=A0ABC8R7D4_9AQUA